MNFKSLCLPAAFVFGTALLAVPSSGQTRPAAPASPYGGEVVEQIVARVNDQIITTSDYDRALQELDQEQRQHGSTMQEMAGAHKDLLRNLIDQQLWLSKGKELGITGETELINRLNDIRKQYNLSSLDDLEKAAQEQGVSFEDFKQNIRNQIITQEVMRQEVGRSINITPGEVQRYFDAHQQEYSQPESVQLSEILVSTENPSSAGTQIGAGQADDPQKVAAAEAKANDVEAKLKAGQNFAQLARAYSDNSTASEGGTLGTYKHGQLAKVFEDQVFNLKAGQFTQPIRTKQGFVILYVVQHPSGGAPNFKDVEPQVEQDYYMTRMEPAIRAYLDKMRDDASIQIANGYADTGATHNKLIQPIAYSAYTPPSPKKKHKVERTRFRETTHGFRQKTTPVSLTTSDQATTAPASADKSKKKSSTKDEASMKPGKKEKIRYGKAPQETLPDKPAMQTEDAGAAGSAQTASADQPPNPLEAAPPKQKTRFSDRAREPKQEKQKEKTAVQAQKNAMTPSAPDAGEVADRQVQSQPLGLNGDTTKKKKNNATGEKTRMSDRNKNKPAEDQNQPQTYTPGNAPQGAPAPNSTPPAPQQPQAPSSQPQQ